MIANLDQKEDTSTLGALRRRIGGGSANGVQKERVVLSAPQRVDGDEPVNEFDMESICNFRDVLADKTTASGIPLSRGIFFRSATLDAATAADADKLLNEVGIRTIVDLRSKSEGSANQFIHPNFRILKDSDEIDGYLASARSRAATENGVNLSEPPPRILFRLDYLDSLTRTMFGWLAWWQKIIFLLILAFWSRPVAIRYFVRRTMGRFDNGLANLNDEILDKSGKELRRMLEILSLSERHPVLFHCSAGKDRTGLTSAILLSLAGVPEDKIVADYTRSERELASVVTYLEAEVQKQGLSTDWAHVPAPVMLHTLEHIRTKYGSLEHYLSSISFPLAAQQKLVHILLAPESERKKKHARRVSRGILPVVDRDTINVGVPGNVKVKEVVEEILDPHED